jgi:hypothetical protein
MAMAMSMNTSPMGGMGGGLGGGMGMGGGLPAMGGMTMQMVPTLEQAPVSVWVRSTRTRERNGKQGRRGTQPHVFVFGGVCGLCVRLQGSVAALPLLRCLCRSALRPALTSAPFALFCFVLFCFVLFCFVLFCFVLLCACVRCSVSTRMATSTCAWVRDPTAQQPICTRTDGIPVDWMDGLFVLLSSVGSMYV